jgi:hypothetical protein
MGGSVRNLGLAIESLGLAVTVMLLLGSIAGAADTSECPSVQALICSSSQPADKSCFRAGATFVQQGNDWQFVTESLPIQQPSSRLNFFVAVDTNNTKQKYGLVFVGIMRSPSVSTTTKGVRLSKNEDLSSPDNSELLETYKKAVTSHGPVTTPLFAWEKFTDTDYLFTTADATELEKLDFNPEQERTDLHARLYRFQSQAGVICVPFWVGIKSNFRTISGLTLDIYGLPPPMTDTSAQASHKVSKGDEGLVQANHFSLKINSGQTQ